MGIRRLEFRTWHKGAKELRLVTVWFVVHMIRRCTGHQDLRTPELEDTTLCGILRYSLNCDTKVSEEKILSNISVWLLLCHLNLNTY